ncbi:MAG: Transporter [Thermoleophilia bacterium]|nr:Transporter [Thermoleophilia bacterium]
MDEAGSTPSPNDASQVRSGMRLPTDAATLATRLRDGDRRALARAISLAENGDPVGHELVRDLYPATGDARLLGITGPPGVGKSSLVGALVAAARSERPDEHVGIVSVDPSSPFTHGALLGDRIRLADHFLDRGVFIRSMGTRGHLGGLAEASLQAALLMDAWGASEIFLETVGVGQSEIEIARIADTIVLVLMPGSGDAVQALKAGIMEIPDIIVINKADHPMARTLHAQVRSILTLERTDWVPPIVETEAVRGEGIDTLWKRIFEHREFLAQEGRFEARRRANLESEVYTLASARALRRLQARVNEDPRLRQLLDGMHRRELDPLTTTMRLFEEVFER